MMVDPFIFKVLQHAGRKGPKENSITILATHAFEDIEDVASLSKTGNVIFAGKQLGDYSKIIAHAKLSANGAAAIAHTTTMKGVLAEAEKLVLHNAKLTRTMAQIGKTVREVFALKRAMETMIISRLRMIMSIKSRLTSGIFDPQADLRDFEDYLRNSIGRTAEDKIATMNRIAMFDATLARLYHDLQTAEARQAGAALEMKQAKEKLDDELAKPQTEQCGTCISDLKLEIASCEKMIADLDTQISNLSTQIEERVKLYNLTMEERVRIANRVKATDEAWDQLSIVKDGIFAAIERGGVPSPSPRRP